MRKTIAILNIVQAEVKHKSINHYINYKHENNDL